MEYKLLHFYSVGLTRLQEEANEQKLEYVLGRKKKKKGISWLYTTTPSSQPKESSMNEVAWIFIDEHLTLDKIIHYVFSLVGGIKPLVYVSGEMSGYEGFNFPTFNVTTTLLESLGYEVINPADQGVIRGWKWEDYLKEDVKKIVDVDMLVTLPNWQMSEGAEFEVYVAKKLKIPVLTLGEAIEKSVEVWKKILSPAVPHGEEM